MGKAACLDEGTHVCVQETYSAPASGLGLGVRASPLPSTMAVLGGTWKQAPH